MFELRCDQRVLSCRQGVGPPDVHGGHASRIGRLTVWLRAFEAAAPSASAGEDEGSDHRAELGHAIVVAGGQPSCEIAYAGHVAFVGTAGLVWLAAHVSGEPGDRAARPGVIASARPKDTARSASGGQPRVFADASLPPWRSVPQVRQRRSRGARIGETLAGRSRAPGGRLVVAADLAIA